MFYFNLSFLVILRLKNKKIQIFTFTPPLLLQSIQNTAVHMCEIAIIARYVFGFASKNALFSLFLFLWSTPPFCLVKPTCRGSVVPEVASVPVWHYCLWAAALGIKRSYQDDSKGVCGEPVEAFPPAPCQWITEGEGSHSFDSIHCWIRFKMWRESAIDLLMTESPLLIKLT